MSKLQKHIDLLTAESNKCITQMENDDYTVNELINAHDRIGKITAAIMFLQNIQRIIAQNNSRIVSPPGHNGMSIIN